MEITAEKLKHTLDCNNASKTKWEDFKFIDGTLTEELIEDYKSLQTKQANGGKRKNQNTIRRNSEES